MRSCNIPSMCVLVWISSSSGIDLSVPWKREFKVEDEIKKQKEWKNAIWLAYDIIRLRYTIISLVKSYICYFEIIILFSEDKRKKNK